MSIQLLQVGSKVIQAHEVLSLLSRYQLLPQFVCNLILDRAIAHITCTTEEPIAAIAGFQPAALKLPAASQFEKRYIIIPL